MNKKPNPHPGGSNLPLDMFKCLSCLKLPDGQIFQCKNGHPICDNCYAKKGPRRDRCPKCKVQLALENKIRNEYLETILDGMEFDCEFGRNGCKQKRTRQMLSRHNKTCAYRKAIRVQKNPKTTESPMDLVEDEDCGIINQAKNPSKAAQGIIPSDDDDILEGAEGPGDGNQDSRSDPNPETPSCSRNNGLRRKRKININHYETRTQDDEKTDKPERKNQVCDIFSLSPSQISKLTSQPKQVEQYDKCKLFLLDEWSSRKIPAVGNFFSKCGPEFEALFVRMWYTEEIIRFFEGILQYVTNLVRLSYRYQHGQDALHLLASLKIHKEKGNLQTLTCFKLVGESGKESLRNEHIIKLSKVGINFKSLELGDSLQQDVDPSSVKKLLENCKSSLETLIINGGFLGSGDSAHKVLAFPRMEVLSTLEICPNYGFLSEVKDPVSKKARIVHLQDEQEEPFKVTVQFKDNFPNLKYLVLGSLIQLEDLSFFTVRKLIEFRCGSFWNHSVNFPLEYSRISLRQGTITDFQFPDGLKDPSLPAKVARYFPHLKNIHLYLPSMAVLQAFFQAFENSEVENLYLKIQFDFETTLESCLLPGTIRTKALGEGTKTVIKMLNKYKHFEEYATYYNLQFPAEKMDDDLRVTNYPGIGGLTNLKALDLQHIPRKLLIPVEKEERKWYDHKCKFMSTTFGFKEYPLESKCYEGIFKLCLGIVMDSQNVKIPKSPVDRIQVNELFLKNKVGSVAFLPSMLLPEIKIKPESDNE